MMPGTKTICGAVLVVLFLGMPARGQVCAGDCDSNGVVSVDEADRAIAAFFESASLTTCSRADVDGDGAVEVNEAVLAMRAALGLGCGVPFAARAVTGPVIVEAGTALGVPGQNTTVQVRLHDNGLEVAGVSNQLVTDPTGPLCLTSAAVNPAINKNGSAFAHSGCNSMLALILSLSNVDPIPNGSVMYDVEVEVAPGTPQGFYPIIVTEPAASDPQGNELQASGVAGGIFVGTVSSTCGNSAVELDETCDDGNLAGGDGCAANCTQERPLVVSLPQSQATLQTSSFPISLSFGGQQELLIGSPRASDPNAIIPIVSTVSGTSFAPIPIPGLACVCARATQAASQGPDVSGVGEFGCGVAGLFDSDYHLSRDHNTDDVDPTCSQGTVESSPHSGVCNGPLVETRSGQGVPGSGSIEMTLSLSLLSDGVGCTTDHAFESPCPFPSYGADCLPCTADDAVIAPAFSLGLTTGTAEATIDDADNVSGRTIGDGVLCGSEPCLTRVEGEPFSCSELMFGTTVSGGAWAGAHPILDEPEIGDNVLSVHLGAVVPTPSPTPTRTRTNTRTPTRTRTPTPTATLPNAAGSFILTRVKIKADTATRPGRDNGSLSAKGTVNVNDPFAGFIDEVLATGLSAIVTGAGGIDFSLAWAGAQCSSRATARGPVLTCVGSDQEKVVLKPTRIPNVFRMTMKGRRLDLQPPLTADPVFVELRTVNSRRIDSIAACRLRGDERTTCRESGFVGTTPTPTNTPTFTPLPACPSDCNGNSSVSIAELIRLINIGIGFTDLSSCTAADSDGTGSVDVTDGVRGVYFSLQGCGAVRPSPTPGGTGTVGVQAGSASGVVAGTSAIEVRLDTAGFDVVAVQNRLSISPFADVCFEDCEVNEALDKNATAFVVESCTSVQAWIMSLSDLDPIPDGALLYTCAVSIGSGAPLASNPVAVTDVVAADWRGYGLPAIGIPGGVTVGTIAAVIP